MTPSFLLTILSLITTIWRRTGYGKAVFSLRRRALKLTLRPSAPSRNQLLRFVHSLAPATGLARQPVSPVALGQD
jgi:hypothetical protein